MDYSKVVAEQHTPQSEPLPGQVADHAGGHWWALDCWKALDRFLILGTEGGTYYVSERTLTKDAAKAVQACIDEDPARVVARVVEISEAGRAPKNDPAIFVLALVASHPKWSVRALAYPAVPRVCRIGTYIFQFAEMAQTLRGWGRGLRRAVASWYSSKGDDLAYQLVKYRQRNWWTHRDLLRLSHAKPTGEAHQALFRWALGKAGAAEQAPALVRAFEQLQIETDPKVAVDLIREHRLPWEAVPSALHGERQVWSALLESMLYIATIRNLARLTASGVLTPMGADTALAVSRIRDAAQIARSRVHPIQILAALVTYAQGHGERGKLAWQPIPQVLDALNEAFYLSFKNVEPTGKRLCLALDVSASMEWGAVSGVPGLTPRAASAAMALVTARVEPRYALVAFSTEMVPVSISPSSRLDDVVKTLRAIPMGGTDCAAPILWARQNSVEVDAFAVFTDSETWAGAVHPAAALRQYRRATGIPAKLVVVGMVANQGSIADPSDAGMMDISGFDVATPNVISEFVRE